MSAQDMLVVENVEAGYGEAKVLFGVSFRVRRGSITTLLGSNGAGKTTTLKVVTGLLKPWSGRILFKGVDVTDWPPYRRVEEGMSMVPEGRRLWPQLTVEENLLLAANATRRAKERMRENLEMVYTLFPRLKERRRQLAGTLSGGEQQMLAIGRALMTSPELLILDEPSLGLAPKLVIDVLQTVKRLRDEYGITVLLVEQNVHMALTIADYGYVLENGRIVVEGEPGKLAESEALRRAYLGLGG